MPKFGEWTPAVKEKPPLFEPVIISRIDKYGHPATCGGVYIGDGIWRIAGASRSKTIAVVGWMPYPAAMEVQKDD